MFHVIECRHLEVQTKVSRRRIHDIKLAFGLAEVEGTMVQNGLACSPFQATIFLQAISLEMFTSWNFIYWFSCFFCGFARWINVLDKPPHLTVWWFHGRKVICPDWTNIYKSCSYILPVCTFPCPLRRYFQRFESVKTRFKTASYPGAGYNFRHRHPHETLSHFSIMNLRPIYETKPKHSDLYIVNNASRSNLSSNYICMLHASR